MKDRLDKAKKQYNSIEIPPELEAVVENALNKKQISRSVVRPLFYRYAAIAACILVCVLFGVRYITLPNDESAVVPTEAAVEFIPSGKAISGPQIAYDATEEATATNAKNSEVVITELYSDENIHSYLELDSNSGTTIYHNIKLVDGTEILLGELVGDESQLITDNSVFYFKSKSEIVVICDGAEHIVSIK